MSIEKLEDRFLRELAMEILAISKEAILLSGDKTSNDFALTHLVITLSETLGPVLTFLKNNEEILKAALISLQKYGEMRERRANEPMKIYKSLIVEDC